MTELRPSGWSPDGATLLVEATFPDTGRDVLTASTSEPGTWEPLVQTPANEWSPVLSPDGRWLAYMSDQSGREEVYVQQYPELSGRIQISTGGGHAPSWSFDGRELFYVSGESSEEQTLMVVSIAVDEDNPLNLIAGTPERLFDWSSLTLGRFRRYGVSRDGQRFLAFLRNEEGSRQIYIVQDWYQELTERVPLP